jgi:hypothetical protein
VTKTIKSTLLALGLVACMGTAQAYPAAWSDSYDPSDVLIAQGAAPLNFQLNLGDDGFNAATDTIHAASLTVWLYDDNLFGDNKFLGDGSEKVKFNFDNTGWSASSEVNGLGLNLGWLDDIFEHTFWFTSLTDLLSDGLLNVSLKSGAGDFRFDKSLLVAYGDRAKVPEPATVALLGAALLGFAIVQRRRRRQSAI